MSDGFTPQPPPPGGSDRRVEAASAATSPRTAEPTIRRPLAPRPSAFAALRHRNFRIFFTGYLVSLVGVWMHRVAQSWLVLDLTDSAFYVGLVEALGGLPVLLFTLYAGTVVDRVSKHRLVIGAQTAAMLLALTLAAVTLGGVVRLWHVLAVAALLGTVTAFDIPARQSLFAELVGRGDLMNAIALNSSAFNASRVVGPAVAGVLIAAAGVGVCFLVNGLSYVAVLVALLAMRVAPFRGSVGPGSTWRRIRDGVGYVTSEPRTRSLVANVAVLSLLGFSFAVLLPVIARDVLRRGPEAFGWMTAAVGLGAMAGALGLAVFGPSVHRGRAVGWMSAGFGLLVAAFGLAPTLGVALPLLALTGFFQITTTALTNTLLQVLAPDELRGRVVSFYTFAFVGMAPFGALAMGAAAERVGPRVALVVGGAACAVVSGLVLVRRRELRETR